MKRLLLAVCVLALAAPAAQAGGFNLTWGTGCWRDNPATLSTFACDSNDGSVSFTVSFATDTELPGFSLFQAELDLQSDSPDLPDWWQLTDSGGCRQGSLSISTDVAAPPGGCADPFAGRQITYEYHHWFTAAFPDPLPGYPANRAKLGVEYGVEPPAGTLQRGIECEGATVTISFAKTVGAGACGGCSTPVTIVLNKVDLWGTGHKILTNPIDNQCLRWQAGGVTPCSATPARSSTWGMLESLYW